MLGRSDEAFAPVQRPIELSPKDTDLNVWTMYVGVIHLHLEQDAQAIEWLQRAVYLNPKSRFAHLFLASALALANRDEEARREIAEFRQLSPEFTLSRFKALEPSDKPAFLEQRQRVYEGLRRAGLPE